MVNNLVYICGGIVTTVALLAIPVVLLVGWVLNILSLMQSPVLALWGGIEVVRFIGVFVAPLGAVLGYF